MLAIQAGEFVAVPMGLAGITPAAGVQGGGRLDGHAGNDVADGVSHTYRFDNRRAYPFLRVRSLFPARPRMTCVINQAFLRARDKGLS